MSQSVASALPETPPSAEKPPRSFAGKKPGWFPDQNHPNWLIKPRGKPMVSETPILGNTHMSMQHPKMPVSAVNMHGTPMQMHVVAQFTIQSGI